MLAFPKGGFKKEIILNRDSDS